MCKYLLFSICFITVYALEVIYANWVHMLETPSNAELLGFAFATGGSAMVGVCTPWTSVNNRRSGIVPLGELAVKHWPAHCCL